MTHFLVVANAAAGSAEQDGVRQAVGIIAESGTVSLRWTDPDDDLNALVTDLAPDAIVIAGGDGSVHHVVNAVGKETLSSIPFGIIPVGTANDLARGMGIPLDPAEAAASLVGVATHPVAMLRGPGNEWAANNAHIGVGVAAARRGTDWKGFLGRLAYPAGALVEAVDFDGVTCVVSVDDVRVFAGSALTVMMMLGSSAGGGFEVGSVAVEEPNSEILVIEAGSVVDRVRAGAAVAAGDEVPGVTRVLGTTITIKCEGDVEGEIDGEFRTWTSPIQFRMVPEAWNLITAQEDSG